MKVLFAGVFCRGDMNSAHVSALSSIGHQTTIYDWRESGPDGLLPLFNSIMPHAVIISKGTGISADAIIQMKKVATVCLWFMDATLPENWTQDLTSKIQAADIFCSHTLAAADLGRVFNQNTYHILEGYDHRFDRPTIVGKDIDIGFVGTEHTETRKQLLRSVELRPTFGMFDQDYATEISRTKINLNICTHRCASNRVLRVLAIGGFLLTDDWYGRDGLFENEVDLVLYNGAKDLKEKIAYYLAHEKERAAIAAQGQRKVLPFSSLEWAKKIMALI